MKYVFTSFFFCLKICFHLSLRFGSQFLYSICFKSFLNKRSFLNKSQEWYSQTPITTLAPTTLKPVRPLVQVRENRKTDHLKLHSILVNVIFILFVLSQGLLTSLLESSCCLFQYLCALKNLKIDRHIHSKTVSN
jgi:hypothetical protein